jgi:hypothetical protein
MKVMAWRGKARGVSIDNATDVQDILNERTGREN